MEDILGVKKNPVLLNRSKKFDDHRAIYAVQTTCILKSVHLLFFAAWTGCQQWGRPRCDTMLHRPVPGPRGLPPRKRPHAVHVDRSARQQRVGPEHVRGDVAGADQHRIAAAARAGQPHVETDEEPHQDVAIGKAKIYEGMSSIFFSFGFACLFISVILFSFDIYLFDLVFNSIQSKWGFIR